MRYRLTTQPTVGPGKVTEELDRLLKNARRLTTSLVLVGPPYKTLPMTATVLEIPNPFAQMATRVLEVILGPSGQSEPLRDVPMRKEWTKHALLVPKKGAQPLVESLFEGWSSASLHLHWRPGRCAGVIHYCEGDTARVAALASLGWGARPLPAQAVNMAASVCLGLSWVSRVAHQPFLGKPLVTPTAQPVVAATSGGRSMTPTTLFSEPQESVFQAGSRSAAPPREPATMRPTGIGTVLAPPGGDGFPLGTTLDGQAIKLAWNALLLSVIAPEDRQRDLVLTLVSRAIGHDLGLIAVIPQSLVSSRQLAAWSTRVRALDPRNLWESHAIPWHLIDPVLLSEALAAAGVQTPPPSSLPATFGEFLSSVPGGERYCTEAVLALTAPEGDDLRGVIEAGGGVLLIDDSSPSSRLLSMLLFALLASGAPIGRRLLIVRPTHYCVPAALSERAIHVVLGEDAAALGTLRATSDAWRLTHADGSLATELDADLERPPSTLDESSYGTLLNTLDGRADEQPRGQPDALAAQPLIGAAATTTSGLPDDDGDDDLFAAPFASIAQPPVADDLFTGSLDLATPFAQAAPPAAPASAAVSAGGDPFTEATSLGSPFGVNGTTPAEDDLFTFDSPAAAPAPAQGAASDEGVFNTFFDIPLGVDLAGPPAPPAPDWMALPSAAPAAGSALPYDGLSFAASGLDDLDPFASPGAYAALEGAGADDGPFADMFAQPIDLLTPAPIADPTPNNTAPVGEGDLGFDPFATPLDFGGIPATTAAAHEPVELFASGTGFLSTDSIFPSLGTSDASSPWDLPAGEPHSGLGDLELAIPGASFDTPADVRTAEEAMASGVVALPIGTDDMTTLPGLADAQIIPTDFQGWQAAPDAAATWASAPWINGQSSGMVEQPLADAPGIATNEAQEPAGAPLAGDVPLEPDDEAAPRGYPTIETARQPLATSRPLARRRRRAWQPPQRHDHSAAIAADVVAGAAERPGAGEEEDGDVPLDEVTLALTAGDLDLAAVPSFDGLEFTLPPVGDDTSVAAQLDAALPGLLPDLDAENMAGRGAAQAAPPVAEHDMAAPAEPLDAAASAAGDVLAGPTTMPQTDDQPLILPISLDVPDTADLDTLGLGTAPAAPALAAEMAAAPEDEAAPLSALAAAWAPPEAQPVVSAPHTTLSVAAPWAAPADLAFDADAVYAAWRGGTGMAELVDLVARTNPHADRSLIRRTIRALLDARSAAGPLLAAPITPLWSASVTSAGNGAGATFAPGVGQEALITAPAGAGWGASVASNGAEQHAGSHQDALQTVGTAPSAVPTQTLDVAGHAPQAPDVALDTAGHVPQMPDAALDTAINIGMPVVSSASGAALDMATNIGMPKTMLAVLAEAPASDRAAEDVVPPLATDDAAAAMDEGLLPPSGGDDHLDEEGIWVRWTNNDELPDIIRAMCGYTRGRAADEARDRVYRLVVPRIVAELDAEVLVTRLLDGRAPLRSQMPQLDDLLKRMNRQAGPVTGVIRDKTIARLIASMRETRASSVA